MEMICRVLHLTHILYPDRILFALRWFQCTNIAAINIHVNSVSFVRYRQAICRWVKLFHKIFVATISGMLAGIVGIPTEMINTRMQVDRELSPRHRRNYKHVFDGLRRVCREEGFRALYTGGLFACSRAALVTIGQNAMYDQVSN